jgi:hypothetical protein
MPFALAKRLVRGPRAENDEDVPQYPAVVEASTPVQGDYAVHPGTQRQLRQDRPGCGPPKLRQESVSHHIPDEVQSLGRVVLREEVARTIGQREEGVVTERIDLLPGARIQAPEIGLDMAQSQRSSGGLKGADHGGVDVTRHHRDAAYELGDHPLAVEDCPGHLLGVPPTLSGDDPAGGSRLREK